MEYSGEYDSFDAYGLPVADMAPDGDQPWEVDAGQAVLDGQEDIDWMLRAAALVHEADADDTTPVRAPWASELAAYDVLALADDESRLKYLSDTLRDTFAQLGEYPTPAESAAYADCQAEHAVLQKRMNGALTAFRQAVGLVDAEEETHGRRRESSIHAGSCMMPDGRMASVKHSVVLRSNEQGLSDADHSSAITVDISVAYRHELRPDDEVYSSNAIPGRVSIYARDIAVGDVATVVEGLAHGIQLDARREAVKPWVESFMSLPQPTVDPPADEEYGMKHMSFGIREVFAGPTNYDDAVTTLAFAFNGDVREDVQRILDAPLPDIIDKVQYYGVAERFAWLLEHAVAIQRDIIQAERQALDNRLPEAYMAWQARKEDTMDQLSELTDVLRHLPCLPPKRPHGKSLDRRNIEIVQRFFARVKGRQS
jgi:hypothetical protein